MLWQLNGTVDDDLRMVCVIAVTGFELNNSLVSKLEV